MNSLTRIDLSNIDPNPETARALFQHVAQRTWHSLDYLLGVCETHFALDLGTLKTMLNSASHQHPSPEFFLLHHALKTAIEAQAPEQVLIEINRATACPPGHFSLSHYGKLRFVNLDEHDWAMECARIAPEAAQANPMQWRHSAQEKQFLNDMIAISDEVMTMLSQSSLALHDEIMAHVNTIILSCNGKLTGPLGYPLFGGTSISYHGALFMQIPSEYVFFKELILEHIVHEAAHIHLNAILATDELVLNDMTELHASSVRKDPRPLIGIYHAMFVSCRVLMAFAQCRRHLNKTYMKKQQFIVQAQFEGAFHTCERYARLTPLGQKILDNCRKQLPTA